MVVGKQHDNLVNSKKSQGRFHKNVTVVLTVGTQEERTMPVEFHASGGISFTGEDGVGLFRLITLYHALRLQANTGMKACRISAVACAKRLGYEGRTAKALLADMERKHPELKRSTQHV